MIRLTDEEIQAAAAKYASVFEINGKILSKVEILQRQHARLRAPVETQLKRVVEWLPSKFRREVIPSGSKVYSQDVVELLQRLNSTYYMLPKADWQSLIDEIKEGNDEL